MNNKFADLSKKRFGKLIVLERDNSKDGSIYWLCVCDCGSLKSIRGDHLKTGKIVSCGCYGKTHICVTSFKHGKTKTSTYRCWTAMRARCEKTYDPRWSRYGGRGIKVCDRWQDFSNFLEDMGERPSCEYSIERIDNDGHYEPGNCRWATKTEQARNRSTSRLETLNGETKTVAEWAEFYGMDHGLIRGRMWRGWSLEEALFTKKL